MSFRMVAREGRMEGYSNYREMYEITSIDEWVLGVVCGVREWVKKSTLK